MIEAFKYLKVINKSVNTLTVILLAISKVQ